MFNESDLVYVGPESVIRVLPINEDRKCQGSIYSGSICIINLGKENDDLLLLGLDMITASRVFDVLACFKFLCNETIDYTVRAVKGNKDCQEAVFREIGKENFLEIMGRKIPNQVIEAIIKEGLEIGDVCPICAPDLITEEVKKGTIVWRDEFKTIGVLTPEELDREREAIEKNISRYRELVDSYIKFVNLKDKAIIQFIKEMISDFCERGIGEKFPDPVFVALVCAYAITVFKYQSKLLPVTGFTLSQSILSVEWLKSKNSYCPVGVFVRDLLEVQRIIS